MIPPPKPVTVSEALRSARETRALEIGSNILPRAASLFREQFGDKKAIVVTDSVTFDIVGKAVKESFRSSKTGCLDPFVYRDPNLYAEYKYVAELEEALKQTDAIPVAVGAGTINDLAKLGAHLAGRPYMCIATAASMDGYTAFGASITRHGSKQTFTCPAPQAVLADLEVIRRAPAWMNASGYADLLAKTTAGADWILADALGVEPIQPEAWRIVQGGLREMLANPKGIPSGDLNTISLLTQGLMLGGFAMQSARSSRPASGAEHQFSHLWDMQHHTHDGIAPSHGFKVGISTLAITALYECLFDYPVENLFVAKPVSPRPDNAAHEAQLGELFPEEDLRNVALQETKAKEISWEAQCAQLEKLRSVWPDLKPKLQAQLFPFAQVKEMLREAGAAYEPEQIGISRERLHVSFMLAQMIRRRFTILDVVGRAGLMDVFLKKLFGPSGVWPVKTESAKSST